MKMRFRLISVATSTFLVAAVSGCANNDPDPAASPSVSSSASAPTTSATTSASPIAPSDAATAEATSTIQGYVAMVDELRSDPEANLERLQSVATGAQLSAIQTLIRRQRSEGQHQTGTTTINELTVQSVNLDNSDPDAGKVPTVVIDLCWDVTKVDVLDKNGESIISPDRPDTGWTRYTVANYEYAADAIGGWRVATGQDLNQTPCAAS